MKDSLSLILPLAGILPNGRVSARPRKIHRQTGKEYSQSDQTIAGIAVNRAERDRAAGRNKEQRRQRVAGNAKRSGCGNPTVREGALIRIPDGRVSALLAKREHASSRERKENYVGRNHVIQNLFVTAREADDDGQRSLQSDREGRHPRPV